jgi:hypothetical protein
MTTTANIAAKFNVLESAIVRVEEWANVMFAVIKGIGSRFVSKKLKVEENKMNFTESVNRCGHKIWSHNSGAKVEQYSDGKYCPTRKYENVQCLIPTMSSRTVDDLEYAKGIALASQLKLNEEILQAAKIIEQNKRSEDAKDRAFAIANGMHQTSTGEWVDESEYYAAQENGIDL